MAPKKCSICNNHKDVNTDKHFFDSPRNESQRAVWVIAMKTSYGTNNTNFILILISSFVRTISMQVFHISKSILGKFHVFWSSYS